MSTTTPIPAFDPALRHELDKQRAVARHALGDIAVDLRMYRERLPASDPLHGPLTEAGFWLSSAQGLDPYITVALEHLLDETDTDQYFEIEKVCYRISSDIGSARAVLKKVIATPGRGYLKSLAEALDVLAKDYRMIGDRAGVAARV